MSVRWTVRSKEVHTSKATWVGEKPKDGGKAWVSECLDWIRENKEPGQLIINCGTGGSVSDLTFVQEERSPSPQFEDESIDEANSI